MNITGAVRIDLSRLVDVGLLQVDEAYATDIWCALGEPQHVCELYIGDAVEVHFAARLVEAFQDVAHVRVVGTNSRGVTKAIQALERLLDRGAA